MLIYVWRLFLLVFKLEQIPMVCGQFLVVLLTTSNSIIIVFSFAAVPLAILVAEMQAGSAERWLHLGPKGSVHHLADYHIGQCTAHDRHDVFMQLQMQSVTPMPFFNVLLLFPYDKSNTS